MKKRLFANPPKYPTMPIQSISFGGLGGGSHCPNCDTLIGKMDRDLSYCKKCHYIYGTKNPKQILEDANRCRECGKII